jgi:hypothetical protein
MKTKRYSLLSGLLFVVEIYTLKPGAQTLEISEK